MPIWNYECKKGHHTEGMSSYDDREVPIKCGTCGEKANFVQTYCTNFQFGEKYDSFHADRHRWNLRENKRLGTRGKGYA